MPGVTMDCEGRMQALKGCPLKWGLMSVTDGCEQNYWKTQCPRGTMYGMLLESIQHYIQELHGEAQWQMILQHAGLKNMVFSTHKMYKDELMVSLARSCSEVLSDKSYDEYLYFFGQCFVDFCQHYGYDKILRVAGRHYRDFLYGIDNLHETIRFSYPKLQSPSFIVESEDCNGCVLTYRSKRVGFAYYVTGQLSQCARRLYNVDVHIEILQEIRTSHGCHVKYRLDFPNLGYSPPRSVTTTSTFSKYPRISSNTFFQLFPFCLVFDRWMVIKNTGMNLTNVFDGQSLIGSKISDRFGLRRPLVDFTWENIICLQKVIFEVESQQKLIRKCKSRTCKCAVDRFYHEKNNDRLTYTLLLRGQMKYVDDWSCMAFLCTPLIGNLEDMEKTGLFVNDMNMFDNSQDMVLAGWHHASQLEYLVDQQIETSNQIANNLQKLDEWRQKSNALLYSMIPESIANRLKNGEDPIKTCETFEQVTIMFSYLIGFSEICAQATAFQVVDCINNVFTVFDAIVDRYKAFKVETLGDAVYMVAGGVPDRNTDHTERVAGLALEFVEKAKFLKDPLSGNCLNVRIGIHVGGVVAGIVGKRTPQYCLFGDTVNTASRMQSYGQPGRIHVSQTCHENLQHTDFVTVFRGRVQVKGKGEQSTYWLAGRRNEASTNRMIIKIRSEQLYHKQESLRSIGSAFDLHGLHISTSGVNLCTSPSLSQEQDDEDVVPGNHKDNKTVKKQPLSLSDLRYIDEDDEGSLVNENEIAVFEQTSTENTSSEANTAQSDDENKPAYLSRGRQKHKTRAFFRLESSTSGSETHSEDNSPPDKETFSPPQRKYWTSFAKGTKLEPLEDSGTNLEPLADSGTKLEDSSAKLETLADSGIKLEDSSAKLETLADSGIKLENLADSSTKLETLQDSSTKLQTLRHSSTKLQTSEDSGTKIETLADSDSKLELSSPNQDVVIAEFKFFSLEKDVEPESHLTLPAVHEVTLTAVDTRSSSSTGVKGQKSDPQFDSNHSMPLPSNMIISVPLMNITSEKPNGQTMQSGTASNGVSDVSSQKVNQDRISLDEAATQSDPVLSQKQNRRNNGIPESHPLLSNVELPQTSVSVKEDMCIYLPANGNIPQCVCGNNGVCHCLQARADAFIGNSGKKEFS